MIVRSVLTLALLVSAGGMPTVSASSFDETEPKVLRSFFSRHCYDCHSGDDSEAGLDLTSIGGDLQDPGVLAGWVHVFDRVRSGEMPPRESSEVTAGERRAFADAARKWLLEHQRREHRRLGRVQARRLTNLQLERTLHDLLGIDIPLASELPDEPRTNGFTTVATGQPMSHFQLQGHLALVDRALDEAFRRAVTPEDKEYRDLPARRLVRRNPRRRTREPELIDGRAVTWSSTLIYYGRLPATQARRPGWYRFRVKASGLKLPPTGGVWCTVRSGMCVSSAPLLKYVTSFELTEEPQEWTFDAWLPRQHMLEIRPGDSTLRKARFRGGQVGVGEGGPQDVPGLAIHSMTMERIHNGPNDQQIRTWMFGDLDVELERVRGARPRILLSGQDAKEAAQELITSFASRAFRRPTTAQDVQPFVQMGLDAIERGELLSDALYGAYRAVLCSPRFLYLRETPGELDDYALAARLSYLLWNTMPDAELLELAGCGELQDETVRRQQTERLLADARGQQFIRDFAHEWLELSEIDFTQPDRRLYPRFDLVVQQSMLAETHRFLQTMLDENLSVSHLIDSDFTWLNSRLARFYQISGVTGDTLRRVTIPESSHRGGVLTQGAVLKVTANGTTTSPVTRGVWVAERLLGQHIPPPPDNVPAIEPDIRGARTIRELLNKHRSDTSCAACHVRIDPPGFALENFNAAGEWRENYGRRRGPRVDASSSLADGREFSNISGFRKLVLADPDVLARNVVEKLLTYGTGAPVAFADREGVERIVNEAADGGYGFRDLVHGVINSPTFLSK